MELSTIHGKPFVILENFAGKLNLGRQLEVRNSCITVYKHSVQNHKICINAGWQKLHGSTGGTRQKFWTQTKISSPNIRYFVAIYALFGDLGQKKCLFGSKTVFLGQEVHYYMVYIAYFTELILQICDCAQKRRI